MLDACIDRKPPYPDLTLLLSAPAYCADSNVSYRNLANSMAGSVVLLRPPMNMK